MWFKHPAWIPVAGILAVIDLGAVWPAAQAGEAMHASLHALLAVGFALGAQHLRHRARVPAAGDVIATMEELEARIAELHDLPDFEGRLAELEEHIDFMERALVDARSRANLPPKD